MEQLQAAFMMTIELWVLLAVMLAALCVEEFVKWRGQ